MRKSIAVILSAVLAFQVFCFDAHAISNLFTSDAPIETNITATYNGRIQAGDMAKNLDFKDVADSHWAKEAITRLGALDIVKGYSYSGANKYFPNQQVSKQEAIAFLIRALGMEANAQQEATRLALNATTNAGVLDLWSRGYLVVANQLGIITGAELADGLQQDQSQLDPTTSFVRSAPVEREEVADYIVKALNSVNANSLLPISGQQRIYTYKDWQQISQDRIANVEAVVVNNIMGGYPDGSFKPKGAVTRAQIASILKNIREQYYKAHNIVEKTGVVVDIQETTSIDGTVATKKISYRILNNQGELDEVVYEQQKHSSGTSTTKDVVVFRNGKVSGLQGLQTDDVVEYLIDRDTNEVLYIYDQGTVVEKNVSGTLQPLKDLKANGFITVEDSSGNKYNFQVAKVLYDDETILIDGERVKLSSTPVEDNIVLTLANNVVTNIHYSGQKDVYKEVQGVVVDVQKNLGYITIMDNQGQEITKNFYKNQVTVEKQDYYEDEDEVGYFDQVFPYFKYDPLDRSIDAVEIGDSVTLKLNDDDTVAHIYAKANYTMYYGQIEFIAPKGAVGSKLHVLLEDGSRTILDVSKSIPTFKGNKQVGLSTLEVGDYAKILVNEAVIEAGYTVLMPKEIIIDDLNTLVTNVYRGQISSFNKIQDIMSLQDVTTFSKMGWIDYVTGKDLKLSDEIAYYYNGERVSQDYMAHFSGFSGDVYVAVEEYYGSEKVAMISFRDGIDQVLDSDTVIYSDGVSRFLMDKATGFFNTDEGTIILRNGRMVSAQNIMVPDYAQVVVNGRKAAIVDLSRAPVTDNIKIYRGRIKSIQEGVKFTVQSHAELKDMKWTFSPVKSTYTVDYRTKYVDKDGVKSMTEFMDYTKDSKVDDVYTVFVDGNHASYIVGQPYVKDGVKGEIYKIDNDTISLRDTFYYNKVSASWKDFSRKNIGSEVSLETNTVIIRDGKIVDSSQLKRGDKVRVLTNTELYKQYTTTGNNKVPGYIILVEG